MKQMKWLCAVGLGSLLLVGCDAPGSARETLNSAGFTNIKITGYKPFTCGQDDVSSTGFVATNVQGAKVSGVVCCGILKGCTIRF